MTHKSKKSSFFARLSTFVTRGSNKPVVETSQGVAETANTGTGTISPHDSSTPPILLPPTNDLTTLSIQSPKSQTPIQSSVNKCQKVELLHSMANAASASTSITREPISWSLLHPAAPPADRSRCTPSHDPQGRTPPSRSPSAPSPVGPSRVSLFEGSHDFQMRDVITVFNEVGTAQVALEIGRARLGSLPKHPDMSGQRVEYLPNSRKSDVDKLCERESNSTDLVLCIHGPAGIGKSTLAGHLSDKFRSSGRLAASIFMSAIRTETSGPEAIIKMIAHEIGSRHPQAIPKIVEAMDQCHGTSLETLLQKYILEPLRSLNHPQPLIVIMDAMDEWHDFPTFIKALAILNSQSSVLKFILTDRLNPYASRLAGTDQFSVYTYALGPISTEVIKAYFQKHLEMVPWVDGRKAHSPDVEKLTELSGGLPVWASTVIALLSHPFNESPPHEILAEIVGSRRQVGGSGGLSELYRNALRRLFPSADAQKYFRWYMGAIMVLQERLSLADFSSLTGIPSHLINRIQVALSAVQTRSPPPGSENMIHPATTLFHLSLFEYLLVPTTDASFRISALESHSAIGLKCLEQLATLPLSIHNHFSLRSLQQYVVKYWPHHVFNGTPRSNNHWSQTAHRSALQIIPDTQIGRWAAFFLRAIMPGEVDSLLEDIKEDDMVSTLIKLANWLGKSGGDLWAFQAACLEVAVRVDGDDAKAWAELGLCYLARGYRTGSLQMHEKAVVAFRQTLLLRPDPHPSCAESLNNIATSLRLCYEQNGDRNILSEAIACSRKALAVSPTQDRHRNLHSLANGLSYLYRHNDDLKTLNEVISLYREILALRPVPHPDRPSALGDLASALNDLYHYNSDINTLNESIAVNRDALALYPAAHPYRPSTLNNLASALHSLYQRNRDVDTLNEAISLHCEALGLRPAPHPDRPMSLYNLANALGDMYRRNGDIKSLNEAISLYREALGPLPASHPRRPSLLNNLAVSLHALYEHSIDVGTLDECISLSCEALTLCSAPDLKRAFTLDILARAYLSQFEQNGGMEVLDEAIALRREVLVLCPPGHRRWAGYVKGLVGALEKRCEVTGDDRDLGEIEVLEAALIRCIELGN